MTAKKGLVEFSRTDLRVPLAEGETVPCPNCADRHVVKRDPRPGTRVNLATGAVEQIHNHALYIDCPESAGPILIGIDDRALPEPLELTPRQ